MLSNESGFSATQVNLTSNDVIAQLNEELEMAIDYMADCQSKMTRMCNKLFSGLLCRPEVA